MVVGKNIDKSQKNPLSGNEIEIHKHAPQVITNLNFAGYVHFRKLESMHYDNTQINAVG